MKIQAKLKNLRISPRKARIVTNLLKNMDVNEALIQIKYIVKKSSKPIEKLLKSAIANAENNFGLDKNNLYVYDVQVGEGVKFKRWLPRAFGRATPLIKRSCHIVITLAERVEGKNRKTKEQLEKERKEKMEAKEKMEEQIRKERELIEKKETKRESEIVLSKTKKEAIIKKEESNVSKSGWINKVFRRKSM